MIIIVEGVDRVGKTTLSEIIEERYRDYIDIIRFRDDTRYVHNHLNREVNTEKINTLQNLLEVGVIENIILDRYHMTEFVYGVVERAYKNVDMYDIDKRLAELDRKDTSEEEEDGENVIDPGMSFDGHVHNDVVLIYVVPIDIKLSSAEHGYNLERHLEWFNNFYDNTLIKNKIKVDCLTFKFAIDLIDNLLGFEENPDIPPIEEGTGIMELKYSRILFDGSSSTYELPIDDTEINVYVNGLYMTKDVDYIIDNTGSPNLISFVDIYKDTDICTITYMIKKEG